MIYIELQCCEKQTLWNPYNILLIDAIPQCTLCGKNMAINDMGDIDHELTTGDIIVDYWRFEEYEQLSHKLFKGKKLRGVMQNWHDKKIQVRVLMRGD